MQNKESKRINRLISREQITTIVKDTEVKETKQAKNI